MAKMTKKPTPKAKTTAKPKSKASVATLKLPRATGKPGTKRPSVTPSIPQTVLDTINNELNSVKNSLTDYAEHLRSLDRKRLNGIGVKRLGFIETAYEIALENPEYLPHYLTIEKWTEDHELFLTLRSLKILSAQVTELLKNMEITAADIDCTDALEYYYPVKEAAHRRIDGAETLYKAMEAHFKRQKSPDAPETEKEFLRDAKAIYRGKKDGKVEAQNISPKKTGGVHKVIDEKFTGGAKFKEDIESELKE